MAKNPLKKLPYWVYKLVGVLLMLAAARWLQKKFAWGIGGFLLTYLVLSIILVIYLLYFTELGRNQVAGVKMTADLLRAKKDGERKLKDKN